MQVFTTHQQYFLIGLIAFLLSVPTSSCLAQKSDFPIATNGVIDLSSYSYQSTKTVPLTGQWFFRWNQFVDSTSVFNSPNYITVPGNWNTYTGSYSLFPQDQGYCTYGLRIILPDSGKIWSLRIPPIRTAYKLFANGQLVAQAGELAADQSMTPATMAKNSFLVPGNEVFLLIQVSNYYFAYGGIWKNLQLGNPSIITRSREKSLLMSSLLIGALLIIGLYHFVLYALRRKDRAPLFFGILCLAAGFRELFNTESVFFLIFPSADWPSSIKVLYCTFPIGIISMILYLKALFPDLVSPVITRLIIAINVLFLALILLTPATIYAAWGTLISPLAILECGYFLWISIRASQVKTDGGLILFCDMILLTLCVINDTLYQVGIINTYFLLSGSILIFTLCQSLLLAIRFSTSFAKTEALTVELKIANRTIEQMALRRKEAERRKEVEEVKNRFFSNITHEFRTPLTLIISPIEHLLRIADGGSAIEHSVLQNTLGTIHRNARQLLQLINQLLDLSKLEAGSLRIRESQGDVVIFMDDLINSFQLTAETKGIQLSFQPGLIPEQLLFDDDKWGKISYNLISNALKYTPTGGSVVVKLTADPMQGNGTFTLRLAVVDTGIGIPPDQIPYIFDRFYQIDDSRTRSFEGSGIGLALVKELTDLLQGRLSVESQVGKGTTMTVTGPVRLPHGSHSLPKPALSYPFEWSELLPATIGQSLVDKPPGNHENRPLILVVEDNQDLRQLIASGLSDSYRVITATNGQEGWEICQTELPDLVLSDIMMPLMDGYQLCQLIKQTAQTSHIAVVLLTAKTVVESKLKGLSAGANEYMTKPFDQRELQLRVMNLLQYQTTLRNFYNLQFNKPDNLPLPSYANAFLSQLYQTLERHIDDTKFSVEDLAIDVAMSSRTLNRKLSNLLGMTVSEFIRNYRLRKAAELLKAGHPVSETAYMVGFESPSYFGQCFKELYTLSPSDYVRSVLSEK